MPAEDTSSLDEGMRVTASSAAVVETGINEDEGDGYDDGFEDEEVSPVPQATATFAEDEGEAEGEYEDDYGDDFEEVSPTSPKKINAVPGLDLTEVKEEAARNIQRITRGKQGRKRAAEKQQWKSSQAAWGGQQDAQLDAQKEAAARQIQRIARGKQGRKKASKKEATKKASGLYRKELGDGGEAADEVERQRAVLKIQALARGKQNRKRTAEKKAEFDANPDKKPLGYKQYSEYNGSTDNPYYVKLSTGKKKKGKAGQVYLEDHGRAAVRIQSIQRGKASKARVSKKKEEFAANPELQTKGYKALSEEDAASYDAKLKAGKKRGQ